MLISSVLLSMISSGGMVSEWRAILDTADGNVII
jgi:hypothetical protein